MLRNNRAPDIAKGSFVGPISTQQLSGMSARQQCCPEHCSTLWSCCQCSVAHMAQAVCVPLPFASKIIIIIAAVAHMLVSLVLLCYHRPSCS